jgi:hypothetical protein
MQWLTRDSQELPTSNTELLLQLLRHLKRLVRTGELCKGMLELKFNNAFQTEWFTNCVTISYNNLKPEMAIEELKKSYTSAKLTVMLVLFL